MRIPWKAFLSSLLVSLVVSADEAPVALVGFVQGSIYVESDDTRTDLELFARLSPGKRIVTGDGSKLVLVYFTGERFELGENSSTIVGRTRLEDSRGAIRQLSSVPAMMKLALIRSSELTNTRAAAVRLRLSQKSSCAVKNWDPSSDSFVLAQAAILSFEEMQGATSYTIEIEDEKGKIVHSENYAGTRIALPQGVLIPGGRYYWRISAINKQQCSANDPIPFRTVSQADSEVRQRLLDEIYQQEDDISLLLLLAELDHALGLNREFCDDIGLLRKKATANVQLLKNLSRYNCP